MPSSSQLAPGESPPSRRQLLRERVPERRRPARILHKYFKESLKEDISNLFEGPDTTVAKTRAPSRDRVDTLLDSLGEES